MFKRLIAVATVVFLITSVVSSAFIMASEIEETALTEPDVTESETAFSLEPPIDYEIEPTTEMMPDETEPIEETVLEALQDETIPAEAFEANTESSEEEGTVSTTESLEQPAEEDASIVEPSVEEGSDE